MRYFIGDNQAAVAHTNEQAEAIAREPDMVETDEETYSMVKYQLMVDLYKRRYE